MLEMFGNMQTDILSNFTILEDLSKNALFENISEKLENNIGK